MWCIFIDPSNLTPKKVKEQLSQKELASVYTSIHIYLVLNTHVYKYQWTFYIYMHIFVDPSNLTPKKVKEQLSQKELASINISTYIYIHTYIHIYMYINIRKYTYVVYIYRSFEFDSKEG
jgi:hypothetical protein